MRDFLGFARISPSTSCSLSHRPLAVLSRLALLTEMSSERTGDEDDDEAASALAKAAAATADKAAKLDPVLDERDT